MPIEPARSRTSPAAVVRQLVPLSLLVWVLTTILALVTAALSGGSLRGSFERACLIMTAVVLAVGAVSLAKGPVPLDRGAAGNLVRPLGALSRSSDSFLRPFRLAGGNAPAGGLTGFGAALAIAVELIFVAILV